MPTITRRVLLNDVDAAGVVFYARIMAIAHECYEEAMAGSGLGLDALIRAGRIGLPLVHADADFSHPLRHGDQVACSVCCETIGTKSFTIRVDLTVLGAEPRAAATVRQIHACVDMDRLQSMPLPADLRAKLTALAPVA
ncbi:MAG: acyl-CoA thioesterase [Planctomycetes bacterium]|nr:acyl-CoA thioesterase [Planctomycetota bacterium]